MTNHKLVCTFTKAQFLDKDLDYIKRHVKVKFNKIVIIKNKNIKNLFYLLYQIPAQFAKQLHKIKNTTLIHRKKQTNTLFSINSLNQLIKQNNDGKLDFQYKINWIDYRNKLILINTKQNTLNKVDTQLYEVYRYEK